MSSVAAAMKRSLRESARSLAERNARSRARSRQRASPEPASSPGGMAAPGAGVRAEPRTPSIGRRSASAGKRLFVAPEVGAGETVEIELTPRTDPDDPPQLHEHPG